MAPKFETWMNALQDAVAFHREHQLRWMWLPVPCDLTVRAKMLANPKNDTLYKKLRGPSQSAGVGFEWLAWDTRNTQWLNDYAWLHEWHTKNMICLLEQNSSSTTYDALPPH